MNEQYNEYKQRVVQRTKEVFHKAKQSIQEKSNLVYVVGLIATTLASCTGQQPVQDTLDKRLLFGPGSAYEVSVHTSPWSPDTTVLVSKHLGSTNTPLYMRPRIAATNVSDANARIQSSHIGDDVFLHELNRQELHGLQRLVGGITSDNYLKNSAKVDSIGAVVYERALSTNK